MKEFMAKSGRINETLAELWTGILASGVFFQASVIWLVKDKAAYSMGLWIGIGLAGFLAWNMWRTLDQALDLGEAGAQKALRKWSLLRYGAVLAVLAAAMYSQSVNPLAAFLGVMTLKAAAYLQPFTHKLFKLFRKLRR